MVRRLALFALPAFVLAGSCNILADSKAKLVHFDAAHTDFALNPHDGSLVAIDPNAKTVTLYSADYLGGKTTDSSATVKLKTPPRDVTVKPLGGKKALVAVSLYASGEIHLLDAATLKSVKVVKTELAYCGSLAASRDPKHDWLLVAGGPHEYMAGVFRLDLDNYKLTPVIPAGHTQPTGDLQLDSRGRTLAMVSNGTLSVVGLKPDARGTTYLTSCSDRSFSRGCFPDPWGRFVAGGKQIRTRDGLNKTDTLKACVTGGFTDRPLLTGLVMDGDRWQQKPTACAVISGNTYKTLATFDLPKSMRENKELTFVYPGSGGDTTQRVITEATALADSANKRIIALNGDQAVVATLEDLGVAGEPVLAVRLDGEASVSVGRDAALPLELADPKVAVELADKPSGLTLLKTARGIFLAWKPTAEQVGNHEIQLKLSFRNVERAETLSVVVRQPSIALGFPPKGLEISPDGKLAIAWTTAGGDTHPYPMTDGTPNRVGTELALVDLENEKLLCRKTLSYAIGYATVDANAVYVAMASSDRVNGLSHKDLSRVRQTMTDGPVMYLRSLTDKHLFVLAEDGPTLYDPVRLKATRSNMGGTLGTGTHDHLLVPHRTSWGWVIGDIGYSEDLSKALWLRSEAAVVTRRNLEIARWSGLLGRGVARRMSGGSTHATWNRMLDNGNLTSGTGQRIAEIGFHAAVVLPDHPVLAEVVAEVDEDRNPSGTSLVLRELVAGRKVSSVTLTKHREQSDNPYGAYRHVYNSDSPQIASHGEAVYVTLTERLYVHRIDKDVLARCKSPIRFLPPSDIPALKADGKTTVAFKTAGGTGPLEFETPEAVEGIVVDAKTGRVTVDGNAVAGPMIEQVAQRLAAQHAMDEETDELVRKEATGAAEMIAELTGEKFKGYPLAVPITVTVSDSRSATAEMTQTAILPVDVAVLIKAVEKEAEKLRKQRARLVFSGGDDGETVRRVRELERRVEKLEAKIDLLTELLQKKMQDDQED